MEITALKKTVNGLFTVTHQYQVPVFQRPYAWEPKQLGEFWTTLYSLNPMVGVVEGFRWALLGTNVGISGPSALTIVASSVTAVALLVSGAFYFRRMEKTFADVV